MRVLFSGTIELMEISYIFLKVSYLTEKNLFYQMKKRKLVWILEKLNGKWDERFSVTIKNSREFFARVPWDSRKPRVSNRISRQSVSFVIGAPLPNFRGRKGKQTERQKSSPNLSYWLVTKLVKISWRPDIEPKILFFWILLTMV